MFLSPSVWGPKYWFFLHTASMSYPDSPNETTKRKYYELLSNMPLFLPDSESSTAFVDLMDRYPVSSYLDSRASLTRWVHFIHNKINRKLGKPEPSYAQFMESYYEEHQVKDTTRDEVNKTNNRVRNMCVVFMILLSFILYSARKLIARHMYKSK